MVPKPIVMTFLGPSWLCFEIIAVDGWKSGKNQLIHPWKINGWNIIPWRFGRSFSFLKG